MTADPITTWLGTPDNGEPSQDEPTPKAMSRVEIKTGAPAQDPLGTIRVFPRWQDGHHGRELAIRWSASIDETHPWIILGSDGPQQLSHDSVEGCERIALGEVARELRHPDVTPVPAMSRMQVLWLPGERYALVFDNVTDPSVFEGLDMTAAREALGAVAVLVLEFPVEVL